MTYIHGTSSGIVVRAKESAQDGSDYFEIFINGGSSNSAKIKLIGTVRNGKFIAEKGGK